jgi:hypothetical protein
MPGDPGAHTASLQWEPRKLSSLIGGRKVSLITRLPLVSRSRLREAYGAHASWILILKYFTRFFLQGFLNPKLPKKLSIQKTDEILDARHITFSLPISLAVGSGAERHAVSLKCIRNRRKKSQMQTTCRLQVRAQP